MESSSSNLITFSVFDDATLAKGSNFNTLFAATTSNRHSEYSSFIDTFFLCAFSISLYHVSIVCNLAMSLGMSLSVVKKFNIFKNIVICEVS